MLTLSKKKLIAIPALLILFDMLTSQLIQHQLVNLGQDGNAIISSLQPAICMGVIAAVLLHYRSSFLSLHRLLNVTWLPSLSLALAIFFIVKNVNILFIHLTLTTLLMSLIFNRDKFLGLILNFRPVSYIGQISYGMYIFHMAAYNAVKILVYPNAPPDSVQTITVTFLLTVMVATGSYYLYEKPFMSLKYRLQTPKKNA
jgi:peptidoglycan/LPS O-acetylase OafA/YrhL